jgi:hypothetical protein
MNRLQFGNDEDVDIGGGHAIFKMKGHSFADVFVQLVDRFALREDIFTDAPGAPKVTVVIDFDFYQHGLILQRLSSADHPRFYLPRRPEFGCVVKCASKRIDQTIAKMKNPPRT